MSQESGLHIGVLGAGRMGAIHASQLLAHPDVDRLTIFDADHSAATRLADTIGAGAVSTLDDLRAAGLDAVLIATPSSTHVDMVTWALESGLPAMCEKPIAINLETLDQLIVIAESKSTPVMVGFQRRFDPTLRPLREAIAKGELGQLLMVRATAFDHEPPHKSFLPTSGGIYRDLLIHDFDGVRWLVGSEVVEVTAMGAAIVD